MNQDQNNHYIMFQGKKKAKKGKGTYVRIKTPVSVTITATAPGMAPVSHTLNLNVNGVYKLNFVLGAGGGNNPTTGTPPSTQ